MRRKTPAEGRGFDVVLLNGRRLAEVRLFRRGRFAGRRRRAVQVEAARKTRQPQRGLGGLLVAAGLVAQARRRAIEIETAGQAEAAAILPGKARQAAGR